MADRKSPIKDTYASGNDAAYIKPKLIPDYELQPRDDSGGPEFEPYTMSFGDGGYVYGEEEKAHLQANSGGQHGEEADELDHSVRERAARKAEGANRESSPAPSKSKATQRK